MDNLQNAVQESLPDDVTSESSTEQDVKADSSQQAPEEATPKQAEQKEPPFHEHPRWIERQKEVEELRDQNRRLMDFIQSQQNAPEPPKESIENLNLTDEQLREKVFYENIRKMSREEALKIAEEKSKTILKELNDNKRTLAMMEVERFRKEHPDVTEGSSEEKQIATKVSQGYSLEDAYKTVMYNTALQRAREEAISKSKQQKTQQTTQKLAANLETTGSVGITPQKKETVAEFIEREGKAMGLL